MFELKPGMRVTSVNGTEYIAIPPYLSKQKHNQDDALILVRNTGWSSVTWGENGFSPKEIFEAPENHQDSLNPSKKGKKVWDRDSSPELTSLRAQYELLGAEIAKLEEQLNA